MADNWKEINWSDIEIGQTVKVIETFADGTETTTVGTIDHFDHFAINGWVSRDGRTLVKRSTSAFATLRTIFVKEPTQEEKDAKFTFPHNIGAIVSAEAKRAGYSGQKFIYTGEGSRWIAAHVPSARKRNEQSIREDYQKFTLISEGVA